MPPNVRLGVAFVVLFGVIVALAIVATLDRKPVATVVRVANASSHVPEGYEVTQRGADEHEAQGRREFVVMNGDRGPCEVMVIHKAIDALPPDLPVSELLFVGGGVREWRRNDDARRWATLAPGVGRFEAVCDDPAIARQLAETTTFERATVPSDG